MVFKFALVTCILGLSIAYLSVNAGPTGPTSAPPGPPAPPDPQNGKLGGRFGQGNPQPPLELDEDDDDDDEQGGLFGFGFSFGSDDGAEEESSDDEMVEELSLEEMLSILLEEHFSVRQDCDRMKLAIDESKDATALQKGYEECIKYLDEMNTRGRSWAQEIFGMASV